MPVALNTDIAIASAATVMLGRQPISSFTGTPGAIAGTFYSMVIHDLISSYPWGFAMVKSASLARDTDAPNSTWLYSFALPNPRIGDPEAYYDTDADGAEPFIGWERQGGKVLSDLTAMWCDYKTNPGEAYWPGYFTNLAVHALACRYALPMTDDQSKHDRFFTVAFGTPQEQGQGGLWKAATFADARTQRVQKLPESAFPLVGCRFS